MNIEGKSHPLKKNNIYLIKPHTLHHFELSKDAINMLECKFSATGEVLNTANFLPEILTCPDNRVFNILKEIVNELKDNRYKDSYIYVKLYELILTLNRIKSDSHELFDKTSVSRFEELKQNKFENLIEFIKNNYYDCELTVEDFASIVHLEKTYFSKAFKKVYNLSPMLYLNLIRLQHAQNLLEYTNDSIIEISDKVGFKSFNAFIRAFKKTYKISPKDYRIKIREKIKEKYDKK